MSMRPPACCSAWSLPRRGAPRCSAACRCRRARRSKRGRTPARNYFCGVARSREFGSVEAGSCAAAQLPVLDDPQSRICIFLTEYRDPVDRKCLEADCGKTVAQHRQDRLASLGGKPARKSHVEAEFFHDIWISPAVEILALPRRQVRGISPRTILPIERRAERIEFACTIRGKPFNFGRRLSRHHRDKSADRTNDGRDDRNWPGFPGKRFAGCKQFSFGLAGRQ